MFRRQSLYRFAVLAVLTSSAGVGKPVGQVPLPTEARPGVAYLGDAACANCHSQQTGAQPPNSMAVAMRRAAESEVLKRFPRMDFELGPYRFEIEKSGEAVTYRVKRGDEQIELPVLWAFGHGEMGQTYVLKHDGKLYESRVSFYRELDGLDLTIGAPSAVPASLESAIGQEMSDFEVRECFGCHSTGAVLDSEVDFERLSPGVACEGCHGPAGNHLKAVARKILGTEVEDLAVINPGRFDPAERLDFCGSCHRTLYDVVSQDIRGPANVRFQPYRLVLSRCYDPEDARIGCLACHDPHRGRSHDAESYDPACGACHRTDSDKGGLPVCPVGDQACVSCHMPKIELPGGHHRFADHFIRVVRAGEEYPH